MYYEWGSARYIPELLGIKNPDGKPYAEIWMGTHPGGPSLALVDGEKKPLSDFTGSLSFLFKLLASEKPLSIQVHPDKARARAGYARENALGIPPDAPERGYRDGNHKPEILCALTPFRVLCGFRKPEAAQKMLSVFAYPAAKKLLAAFDTGVDAGENGAMKNFLRVLFDLSDDERTGMSSFIRKNIHPLKNEYKKYAAELGLVEKLEGLFPRDPSVLSPLYLNIMDLKRGEAIFVPPGTIHAYIHGAGVELMAASDNVIRGGLTPKHIDRTELFAAARFEPFMPELLKPAPGGLYKYPVPVSDFSLVRIDNDGVDTAIPVSSPSILVCVNGTVSVCFTDGKRMEIGRGESVFIAECAGKNFYLAGSFEAFMASGSTRNTC
jgi:mannose-6-phosphate isomerase